MLNAMNRQNSGSLITDYASLLGDAVLRSNARRAEHTARIEAELADRVKSEFIANMSHELRTPLNTILGFSKLLGEHGRKQLSEDDIDQYASLIHDAAGHLLSVINDILDIVKLQSGRYTIDTQELIVSEVVEAVIADQQSAANQAQVNVHCKIEPGLEPVRADFTKLGQAFSNILNNAVKFTPPGGDVFVSAHRRRDRGTTFVVRDTGVGMSETDIEIALADFGQVDGGRTRWRDGTGLGLPIARALIEIHGGELSIKSEKGVGTEVTVQLPPKTRVALAEARAQALGKGYP